MSSRTASPGEHRWWSSIPESLRTRSQWIVTKDKEPIRPRTGWNEPDKQMAFDRARRLSVDLEGEPAYVLRAEDPFVIIDFDDVGPPDAVSPEVGQIVKALNTYTEASRSRTGLHLVCTGTRLPDRQQKGELDNGGTVEVFDADRYVVLTGDQIGPFDRITAGNGTCEEDDNVLVKLQQEYLPKRTEPVEANPDNSAFEFDGISENSVDVDVTDVRRTLEEYAKGGSSKAQRVLDRWDSPAGSDCGFQSASEADMGFVADLTFWCQEDAQLMDRCFRTSNRMREKWDEVHYSDGRTYGDGTIQTTVRTNYDTFSGHYVQHR